MRPSSCDHLDREASREQGANLRHPLTDLHRARACMGSVPGSLAERGRRSSRANAETKRVPQRHAVRVHGRQRRARRSRLLPAELPQQSSRGSVDERERPSSEASSLDRDRFVAERDPDALPGVNAEVDRPRQRLRRNLLRPREWIIQSAGDDHGARRRGRARWNRRCAQRVEPRRLVLGRQAKRSHARLDQRVRWPRFRTWWQRAADRREHEDEQSGDRHA